MIKRTFLFPLLCLLPLVAAAQPIEDIPGAVPQEKVLGHLEKLAQWHRDASVIEPASPGPQEQVYRQAARDNSLRALQAAFKFARMQASIAPAVELTDEEKNSPRERMRQRGLEIDRRAAQLRTTLKTGNAAQRADAAAQLKLIAAQQELFETVQANFDAADKSGGASFTAKIGNLQRSIPELIAEGDKQVAPAKPTDEKTPQSSNGLFSLADDLFNVARKQRELGAFAQESKEIEKAGHGMLMELSAALDRISADTKATDADAQVAKYKQVAAIVAPLAETNVWVSTSTSAVKDWYKLLGDRFHQTLKQLGIRIGILLATLAVPIVVGEIAERAIDRYNCEVKRKRQAHNVRRVVVGLALFFVLLLNFMSDFGSFVTFAGFITAGLAVALQGVLLSLVAHFFFYGRYGVRAGDRVVVAGVTGDIVQIGMVRFYLRELKDEEGALQPTGKVVAFPNSILFQPSAFYKYID